ncbi:hypothetical protein F4604DRAFT_1683528 [Suillus subluteus]|nr:hypothetical protein F4604DRAFT_1683528 [Suillus subluteus]
MASASIAPVWLYQPQRPEILQQLLRLSHAFVTLTNDTYDLIGYLADGYQVSPIYCAGSHRQGQTWFNRLDQVGWLVVRGRYRLPLRVIQSDRSQNMIEQVSEHQEFFTE